MSDLSQNVRGSESSHEQAFLYENSLLDLRGDAIAEKYEAAHQKSPFRETKIMKVRRI